MHTKITHKSFQLPTLLSLLFIIFGGCSEDTTPPTDGVDGTDGFNALVNVADEPAGENCSTGGVKISVGQDANGNGTLDSDEILSISFVCNGSDGSDGSNGSDGNDAPILVARTSAESPGTNCSAGGTLVEIGLDLNDNATLDDNEVQTSFYVCNGADGASGTGGGADGLTSLVVVTPIETCGPNNTVGIHIDVGLDDNNDGSLAETEVDASYDICNGADGANGSNSLIAITSFSGAQGGCTNGGLLVQTGIDDNDDGTLQVGEVDATAYVCNGQDGANGADGNSDNIFEFYFQEGFNGYTGVQDGAITNDAKGSSEVNALTFSVDEGTVLGTGDIDYHGLLHFPDINTYIESVTGTSTNTVVEAILYLRGVSVMTEVGTEDNWIGAKIILPTSPLFDESVVTWNQANTSIGWGTPGVTSQSTNGDAFGYSDMFQLPYAFQFDGYIPLLLDKRQVTSWLDPNSGKDNNKGIVLLMASSAIEYQLDIYASEYSKDTNYRPLLYIKVKTDVKGRATETEKSYVANWQSKSYEEKLAPLWRKR